ncbi:unnamed protein product, partial [Allacma fusca]
SALHIGIRIYLSTDWELQPEELDNTAIHLDDSEDEVIQPKVGNPMNVYRISTDLDNFLVRPSTEPFVFNLN